VVAEKKLAPINLPGSIPIHGSEDRREERIAKAAGVG
jgi:hypothetical protein